MRSQSPPPTLPNSNPREKVRLERPSGWFLAEDVLPRNRKERRARYLSRARSAQLARKRLRDRRQRRRELGALLRVVAPLAILAVGGIALVGNPVTVLLVVLAAFAAFYGFSLIERIFRRPE